MWSVLTTLRPCCDVTTPRFLGRPLGGAPGSGDHGGSPATICITHLHGTYLRVPLTATAAKRVGWFEVLLSILREGWAHRATLIFGI